LLERENWLRAARFERPDTIPIRMDINNACWHHYPQDALQALMVEHRLLFPDYRARPLPIRPTYAPWRVAGAPYTDSWGCVWETLENGITGAIVRHALPTWDALDGYGAPDPEHQDGWGRLDWHLETQRIAAARQRGRLAHGSLRHGHTFLTLTYIRSYQGLIFDMSDGEPRLWTLLGMVEEFNRSLVRRYLALGVEWMGYPEDLGMQRGPMLSPVHFRTYIAPLYRRLMAPAREAGCVVHMHADGDIRALADDLLACPIDVLNVQDLVNGLAWLRENLMGRVCIDLDLDRQRVTRFGTPAEIDALVREAVTTLGSHQGGLMLTHGLMPGLPLENVRALMDAMERYAGYYGA
jgi:uroporphyrinogen decarboxylase